LSISALYHISPDLHSVKPDDIIQLMKSRRIVLYIPVILVIVFLPLTFILPAIPSLFTQPNARSLQMQIPISPAVMERQSLNACGPYAVRAVIHMLTGRFFPAEQLNHKMPLRLADKTTLPPGLSMILTDYGLSSESHWMHFSSDQSRLEVLESSIVKGRPVIILVKDYRVQHYLTITGFHGEYFSGYDSMMPLLKQGSRQTIDSNGGFSGNRDIHKSELLKMWGEGGLGILFNYWCVEVYKP